MAIQHPLSGDLSRTDNAILKGSHYAIAHRKPATLFAATFLRSRADCIMPASASGGRPFKDWYAACDNLQELFGLAVSIGNHH